MNEILINIISVIVTAVVIPVITLVGGKLVSWLNAKINNEKANAMLTAATNAVVNAVRSVLQTYVDTLKDSGKFDESSQKIALIKAKKLALESMNAEVQNYIETTYGNIDTWITTMIEATLNAIKVSK